jgi:DNA-binding MarR family transcriptional regulator
MADISVQEFADKMHEIMPVIMREFARRQTNELYKGKITLPQFVALEFLCREGKTRMTGLANFMNITTAAMTGIADRLVRDGYVKRIFEPKDRRIIEIEATAKGHSLVKRISLQRRDMIIRTFGRLSGDDRRDYLRILVQVRDILTSQPPDVK